MSAIRFHFAEGPVLQVRGPERAAMDIRVRDLANATAGLVSPLGRTWADREAAQNFGPFIGLEDPVGDTVPGLADQIAMSFGGTFQKNPFSWKGKEIDAWCLALNTALAIGSDPVRLSAKIHATCEIHGFVEGSDRDWLAGIIEEGLEEGVFRKELTYPKSSFREERAVSMGWTELIEQLRAPHGDDQAVVMSFTVTDGFPDPPEDWRPQLDGEDRWNQWHDLDDWKRFDLALAEIRKDENRKPIGPETLRKYRFRHELSLLDLMARDFDRIEKALGLRE